MLRDLLGRAFEVAIGADARARERPQQALFLLVFLLLGARQHLAAAVLAGRAERFGELFQRAIANFARQRAATGRTGWHFELA